MDYIKRTADVVIEVGDSKQLYAQDIMRAYPIVKEITDHLKTLDLFEKCKDKQGEFAQKMNEQEDLEKKLLRTYYAMLKRIVDSQSTLHIAGSIFIGIPTLYLFMNEYIEKNPGYSVAVV